MGEHEEAGGDGLNCAICGHEGSQHGQESTFYECGGSKREVCLECPGYEEPGYPKGAAWHRFAPVGVEATV